MCIIVTALVLIACVSAMCPGVTVTQLAICTFTLTLAKREANSYQEDVKSCKQHCCNNDCVCLPGVSSYYSPLLNVCRNPKCDWFH